MGMPRWLVVLGWVGWSGFTKRVISKAGQGKARQGKARQGIFWWQTTFRIGSDGLAWLLHGER